MALDPNINQIKVHPAIGFARLSTSPDYYVFDPMSPVRGVYKSGVKIMRQAVQFRLFAYGDNNDGLYELTEERLHEMGLRAIWSVELANGKIESLTQNPSDRFHARGDTGAGDLQLVGNLSTFAEGSSIAMGEIKVDGLFVPPVAAVIRRTLTTPTQQMGMYDRDISDNTSDGSVSARLQEVATGNAIGIAILPAWISICPQDFAPSWNDQGVNHNLLSLLQDKLHTPNAPLTNPINIQARALDRQTLERGTAVFSPGIELDGSFTPAQFYPESVTNDLDEIRFMPSRAGGGVAPGSLTDSLCSPWQYDFRACTCSWWPNHRPDVAFKDDGNGVEGNWRRRIAAESGNSPPSGLLETNPDFIEHVDELGIIKKAPGDPSKHAETERRNDIDPLIA
ncbi:LodA/GoxA family CTQ-dependent oxidase [Mesorhizobium sp. CO1-1-11]|uniref:LodA/GoxA family CTQ-dependent oxidase n=1 Tax=Mesorhizobium sp. CO1-1-11 TaxID=2876636 RepID=UPI001CC9BC2E|nr:LodA/GoxA family CTQ-dependent oxidase [Mesorhizobium sp. CO1-1-11]MBZ9728047.1 LodA/GoxA family CTQ-dependent oxidase [Mesorhizobium sp. CO1-1-11]